MITKNVIISSTPNITLLNFGNGTITFVAGSHESGEKMLLLKSQSPAKKIGSKNLAEKGNSDQWKPEVVLSFSNTESLDVLIESLMEVRELF